MIRLRLFIVAPDAVYVVSVIIVPVRREARRVSAWALRRRPVESPEVADMPWSLN